MVGRCAARPGLQAVAVDGETCGAQVVDDALQLTAGVLIVECVAVAGELIAGDALQCSALGRAVQCGAREAVFLGSRWRDRGIVPSIARPHPLI